MAVSRLETAWNGPETGHQNTQTERTCRHERHLMSMEYHGKFCIRRLSKIRGARSGQRSAPTCSSRPTAGNRIHGVNRLKPIYLDRIKAGIHSRSRSGDRPRDGHDRRGRHVHGRSQVIAWRSMELAVKAKKYGMGMVPPQFHPLRNRGLLRAMRGKGRDVSHNGHNALPLHRSDFGVENMLGTNPLTFGMHRRGLPLFAGYARPTFPAGKNRILRPPR
jgi:LDH2 family malate/lactate/ureidoglycolate dehydrogenase